MSVTKRALLIGSRIDDLEGTENDVEMRAEVLEKYGFEMKRCIGPNATRDGILVAGKSLFPQAHVVVYYSGHGAVAQYDELDEQIDHRQKKSEKISCSHRYWPGHGG